MKHGGNVWDDHIPEKWLDFSANIRPEGPPSWVREALLSGMRDVSFYPDLAMTRARSALGRFLKLPEDFVLPTAGGMWHIAAIPQLLELIPLIYLVMGLVRLWLAKEPLTFRDWYASWRRLGVTATVSAVLTAGMTLAEIVFILFFSGCAVGAEIPYLLAEIACFALSLALAVHVKKHPCTPSVAAEKE